jgi:hypothetical protein
MRILPGDSIVDEMKDVGIVEGRSGSTLTVRYPCYNNVREKRQRLSVKHLAELILEQIQNEGRRLQLKLSSISLRGQSTVAELVSLFGYSTGQLRNTSLSKVLRQVQRAGLEITTRSGLWARDDRFVVKVVRTQEVDPGGEGDDGTETQQVVHRREDSLPEKLEIPEPFWPTALGLAPHRELEFLRSLTLSEPILCILQVPENGPALSWLQATWEGMVGWAYRSAQAFVWRTDSGPDTCSVRLGGVGLLHAHLAPTPLDADVPRLLDNQRSLNLITVKQGAELPVDFDRFCAVWPGPIFEFEPDYGQGSEPPEDVKIINNCLRIVSGCALMVDAVDSPLKILNWARKAYSQLVTMPAGTWGHITSSKEVTNFKGSNEGAATLALKAHVSRWILELDPGAELRFEKCSNAYGPDPYAPRIHQRVDLCVKDLGQFEIESMVGSGPMELFYQRKIFSRAGCDGTEPFWLVVPNYALLWAGPYLADIAYHLGEKGHVILPASNGKVIGIAGKELSRVEVERPPPPPPPGGERDPLHSEAVIKLKDVSGYSGVRKQIDELIVWPERHRFIPQGTSKSSGVLFFGPPGCGKTRWARAIAGELEQEVRLLAPSDLRGPYIGWGQVMIREQFNWLAEKSSRMLIIDEIDAVARSRRTSQMHSDEMASVNELLVQIDRILRLGRLIVGTTNFIGSLDEALTRSGRFGRYIPVGPPDLDESVLIVMYYLEALSSRCSQASRIRIEAPCESSVRSMLGPFFDDSSAAKCRFCGADLEEAVNRAYVRCARAAVPDDYCASDSEQLSIEISPEGLARSIKEVPMSVTADMIEKFKKDVSRYCGNIVRLY